MPAEKPHGGGRAVGSIEADAPPTPRPGMVQGPLQEARPDPLPSPIGMHVEPPQFERVVVESAQADGADQFSLQPGQQKQAAAGLVLAHDVGQVGVGCFWGEGKAQLRQACPQKRDKRGLIGRLKRSISQADMDAQTSAFAGIVRHAKHRPGSLPNRAPASLKRQAASVMIR